MDQSNDRADNPYLHWYFVPVNYKLSAYVTDIDYELSYDDLLNQEKDNKDN